MHTPNRGEKHELGEEVTLPPPRLSSAQFGKERAAFASQVVCELYVRAARRALAQAGEAMSGIRLPAIVADEGDLLSNDS